MAITRLQLSTHMTAASLTAVGAMLLAAAPVRAAGANVTMACASDYLAYCSKHPTEGPAVRQCMRANGSRLSPRCVEALISAGEVSRAEVKRREASAR